MVSRPNQRRPAPPTATAACRHALRARPRFQPRPSRSWFVRSLGISEQGIDDGPGVVRCPDFERSTAFVDCDGEREEPAAVLFGDHETCDLSEWHIVREGQANPAW